MSDLSPSALRAIDKAANDLHLRAKVTASLADPGESVAAAGLFKRLRAIHAEAVKAAEHGA